MRIAERVRSPRQERAARSPAASLLARGIPVVVMIALAAFGAMIAYWRVFTHFADYDDEGYLMISLRGVMEGGGLYDEVFSQYGPFYFLFWSAVFRVGGLALVHDNGRLVTIGIWVATSLLLGAAAWKLTGSGTLGIVTQIIGFLTQSVLINEPMHPGGLLTLLTSLVVAASAFLVPRFRRGALITIGGLGAAIALVKINVGGFVLLAIAFAAVLTLPRARRLGLAVTTLVVATPFLVMAGDLREPWALRYAVSVAAPMVAIALISARPGTGTWHDIRWLVTGATGTALVTLAFALLGGTSLGGLIDGLVMRPLRQADAFALPAFQPDLMIPLAIGGLVLAGLTRAVQGSQRRLGLAWIAGGPGRIVIGGLILVILVGELSTLALPFSLALPLIWIAARGPDPDPVHPFVRILVPALGTLQALHAYPVAGSQAAWSALFLIVPAVMIVADGARVLRRAVAAPGWNPLIARAATVTLLAAFAAWLVVTRIAPAAGPAADAYDAGTELPGTDRVRISTEQAGLYDALSRDLRARCGTLFSLPGMHSLHFFTGIDPPSSLNATAWMFLFDEEDQARVAAALERSPRPCVIRHAGLEAFWAQGRPLPERPLLSLIQEDFQLAEMIGPFEILVPRRTPT